MTRAICLTALLLATTARAQDADTDRDGLPDFHEKHKYFTDPARSDTDGDGTPDGDWSERREYAYTIRTVLRVMPPYNVVAMTDDYQDARVVEEHPGYLEAEIIHYPFNTCDWTIHPDPSWRAAAGRLADDVRPGITTNWDDSMRAALTAELRAQGVDLATLDDRQVAETVSKWAMNRTNFEDSFTTFAVDFPNGKTRIAPGFEDGVNAGLKEHGRTIQQQWDRELFGKGMFETRWRGTCTSSAVYLATCLKAAGLPTRIIICVPSLDASDPDEVAMIAGLTHRGVRRTMQRAAERLSDSWASHTFNEVYVGGRWRRLNYDRLGQNILDEGTMGLMTHVNTFRDLADANLAATWGIRNLKSIRHDVFGHSNPYSCIALSDEFGAHCALKNPEAGGEESR